VREAAELHDRSVEQPEAVFLRERLGVQELPARGLDHGVAEAEFGDVAQAVLGRRARRPSARKEPGMRAGRSIAASAPSVTSAEARRARASHAHATPVIR
jgi:hypothetical protein